MRCGWLVSTPSDEAGWGEGLTLLTMRETARTFLGVGTGRGNSQSMSMPRHLTVGLAESAVDSTVGQIMILP